MPESKTEIIVFRAEPRLAAALKEAASVEAMNMSDYIRTILRLHLFDSSGSHSMGESRPTAPAARELI